MALTQAQMAQYRRDGFVVLEGVVPPALIEQLCRAAARTAAKADPEFPADLADCRGWYEPRFQRELIDFRARDRQGFGAFYDTLQTSAGLQMIFALPELVEAAAQALGDEPSGLTSTGQMLRIDTPNDTRNALVWHQDNAHYPQNDSGDHGLVALVPLVDVGAHNGMIGVLPGSHTEGAVDHENPDKADAVESLQLGVPQEFIDRYEEQTITAFQGDLVLCHMDLVHRSGRNTSDGIRFTAGARFHLAVADDFVPGRLLYEPTRSVLERRGLAAPPR